MPQLLYIKTFGCQMNERDSEIIWQLLSYLGYVPVDQIELADLIILNTCSIRAKAEQKVFSLLGQLKKLKKKNPGLLVGVAGCVAQQEGKQIFKRAPHVNVVVGTQQFYQLPEMISRLEQGLSKQEIATNLSASFTIPPFQKLGKKTPLPSPSLSKEVKKFVTIMQGCNNYCAYCVVPSTRGREISRPAADVLEEVKNHVRNGIREITLLGQNVNSYGQTNKVADVDMSFADLLSQVAGIKGLHRLRFTTSNPKDLSPELVECFANLSNLCPQFHLPLQSGSDFILKRMNRKYTVTQYLEKVASLRSVCPEIAITTDIIIGFPGETEVDFEHTMNILETVRFHGSFSFKYSDRPATRSADFPDKVDEDIKTRRLAEFQARQDEISFEYNQAMVGNQYEVMVENIHENSIQSRTRSGHIVHLPGTDKIQVGDLINAEIYEAGKHSLKGSTITLHFNDN